MQIYETVYTKKYKQNFFLYPLAGKSVWAWNPADPGLANTFRTEHEILPVNHPPMTIRLTDARPEGKRKMGSY